MLYMCVFICSVCMCVFMCVCVCAPDPNGATSYMLYTILSHTMPSEFNIADSATVGLQYDQSTPQPMERSGEKGSITK